MRTQKSWGEQQEALKAAKTLADFANLDLHDVNEFRENNPDFFPQAWWDYRPTDLQGIPLPDPQWRIAQILVRNAWDSEFRIPPFEYVLLLTAVFDPAWTNAGYRPPYAQASDLDEEYPYHRAAEWLTGQGWRAKKCHYDNCKRYFIAEHPKRLFCNFGTIVGDLEKSCFWAHRKADKHDNWAENAEQTNKGRREKYDPKERRRRYLRDRKTRRPSKSPKAKRR